MAIPCPVTQTANGPRTGPLGPDSFAVPRVGAAAGAAAGAGKRDGGLGVPVLGERNGGCGVAVLGEVAGTP